MSRLIIKADVPFRDINWFCYKAIIELFNVSNKKDR